MELAEVRFNPATSAVAVKTTLTANGMEWFVFHPSQGGHYTSGKKEQLDVWPALYYPDIA